MAALGAVIAVSLPLVGVTPARAALRLPKIRHVFVIVLENESATSTFESGDAYMGRGGTLQRLGIYLPDYYATGHVSNDNYIAMVSGQAPNPQNQSDCQFYSDFVGVGPVLSLGTGPTPSPLVGQAVGDGCVYPSSVKTIADQLAAKGLSWKGYMQDMGNDPTRESAVCGHPRLNSQDETQKAEAPGPANHGAGDGYVSRHDPFVYFHSIIDNPAACRNLVPLGGPTGAMPPSAPKGTTGLYDDLYGKAGGRAPNLAFIIPNVCYDGHDYPCTNDPGLSEKTGSAVGDMDAYLKTWVPLITRSPAFKDGLLVITFDEGDVPGDASSCCDEMPGPNSPLPGIAGMGGGRTGAVLISPFIKPGTTSTDSYNHYGLLASMEQLFGLGRLGFAADVPATFGSDVYNRFS